MCVELGPLGIRTNNVNPTVVMTKMGAKAWSDPEKSGPILKRIPLGRFAGNLYYCNNISYVLISELDKD